MCLLLSLRIAKRREYHPKKLSFSFNFKNKLMLNEKDNIFGWNSLLLAIRNDNSESVKILIEYALIHQIIFLNMKKKVLILEIIQK